MPAALTNCAVARYVWYACVRDQAGELGRHRSARNGSVPEPSAACSSVYSAGVNPVPPTGLSGPVTPVNSPLALSWLVAAAMACGSSQAGVDSL